MLFYFRSFLSQGITMINLVFTLITMIFTTNILICKDLNYKSVIGDWNMVDENFQVIGKIRIQEVSDSIDIYKEDSFGNYNKFTSFSKIPVKSGPKGIEFESKWIKVDGRDTTRNLETIKFTVKKNSFDCWYFVERNVPVNHQDWSSYSNNYWGGIIVKDKLNSEEIQTKNGNNFSMNNILGIKWKITTQDGQKGEVKFSMVMDTLYMTFKGKETKGKWITKSTELTTRSVVSMDNEIRFEKIKLSDSLSQETDEEKVYQTTDFMIISKVSKDIYRLVNGHQMRPLKLTENNRFNVLNSSKVSEIRK